MGWGRIWTDWSALSLHSSWVSTLIMVNVVVRWSGCLMMVMFFMTLRGLVGDSEFIVFFKTNH